MITNSLSLSGPGKGTEALPTGHRFGTTLNSTPSQHSPTGAIRDKFWCTAMLLFVWILPSFHGQMSYFSKRNWTCLHRTIETPIKAFGWMLRNFLCMYQGPRYNPKNSKFSDIRTDRLMIGLSLKCLLRERDREDTRTHPNLVKIVENMHLLRSAQMGFNTSQTATGMHGQLQYPRGIRLNHKLQMGYNQFPLWGEVYETHIPCKPIHAECIIQYLG